MKLLNAFSVNMLTGDSDVSFIQVSKELAITYLTGSGFTSAIGHATTACVVANDLGLAVQYNRENVTLDVGDRAVVAQYTGMRLPEGAVQLPDGAKITYWLVEVN